MFKPKSLNNSYNLSYNKKQITFNPHIFKRKHRGLDLNKIEHAIRCGHLFKRKCKFPIKLCFKKYFGKQNKTYYVIAINHETFIEVITAWQKKGKR